MERSPEYCNANDKVTEMSTLSMCTHKALKDGYTENFKVENGTILAASGKTYNSEDVQIVNYYRFEGDSDPADNSILFIIETTDGLKGTLINTMGAYADDDIGAFIINVEDMRKKSPKIHQALERQ
jgi:hypothetical protein